MPQHEEAVGHINAAQAALLKALEALEAPPPAPPEPPLITNIRARTNKQYRQAELVERAVLYTDRPNIRFVEVPLELLEGRYILTPNSDRNSKNLELLTFTLTRDAIVIVAFDDRVPEARRPAWLKEFTKDDLLMKTTDNNSLRRVYVKDYPAGDVVIGGGGTPPNTWCPSNYSVIVL